MNKKIVKFVSVLMVALMFISAFSVIFTVFAAPDNLEDLLNEYKNDLVNAGSVDTATNSVTTGTTETTTEPVTSSQPQEEKEESTTVKVPESTTSGDKVTEEITEKNESSITASESNVTLAVPENASIVTLNIERNYGNIVIIFTNVSNKKEYNVVLKFDESQGYYIGATMMPIGKYEISVEERETEKIKLSEKSIEFRNYEETINIHVSSVKEKTASKFLDFLKNNILLFVLFFGALAVYGVIKFKNRIEN